jgi:uncharacterized repeat protein (TIGR03803 family)
MSGRWLSGVNRYRSGLAAAGFLVAFVGVAPTTAAQSTMDVLHAFGAPAQPATPSYGRLLELPGGTLYGTTTAGAGAIYKVTPDGLGGFTLSVLHAFDGVDGRRPFDGLIDGGDGYLYGTTYEGGESNAGTVYRIDLEGRLTSIHSFNHTDGANPFAGLLDGGDGFLYGTTTQGTIFKLDKSGGSFQTLRSFSPSEGTNPRGRLVRGNDGFLYGTTNSGNSLGAYNGTLFRIAADGTGFVRLHSFLTSTGAYPHGGLLKGSDGKLYGTTTSGGTGGNGVIFSFDPTGGWYTVLHHLTWSEGSSPVAALVEGADGWLYGTTQGGGSNWGGILFRVHRTNGQFARLRSFAPTDGTAPLAALIQGAGGLFYGTASKAGPLAGGTIFRVPSDGLNLTVLAALDATTIEGVLPRDGIVSGGGSFYGTTTGGGAGGTGTTFRMASDGSAFTTLHSLAAATEGDLPSGPLLLHSDGLLYGAARFQGTGGSGTLYRLRPDGSSFEILHAFLSPSEGSGPQGGLADGGDGFLYGTTTSGATNGGGSVFRLNPTERTIGIVYAFPGGSEPEGSLLRKGSSLYGTTRRGGASYLGTVFKLDLPGGGVTTLHTFSGSNGSYPNGGLVEGTDGLLYGTTDSGGQYSNGTLFRLSPAGGAFATLHSFDGNNGRTPDGPLLVGDSGFLYGTTWSGGEHGAGTVFAISPIAGVFSLLYSFYATDSQGDAPDGPLLQTSDGRLYGTTSRTGGDASASGGTVFRLSPPAHVLPATSLTICRDQKGTVLAATTAGPAKSYQWGYRNLYGPPEDITALVGQTSSSYAVNGADFAAVGDGTTVEVVCTIRFTGDYGESTSNPVSVTINAPCGGSLEVPPPVQVFTASTVNGSTSTTLHWVNPAIVVDEIIIRYRTDGIYPASAVDTNAQLLCGLGAPSCGTAAAGAVGTFPHPSQTPGTTYSYAAFTRRSASDSGGKFASATPFNGPSKAAWTYSTGATSVVPPGLRPTSGGTQGAVYTVSNDRGLHAMTLGSGGGDWPAGWKPLLMNAPSQGRPIPVSFPTFTVNGVGKVVYVTSQDGRVYVADALTGGLLRASAQICQGIQHSPGAMLRDYGGAYDVLIVGSRNTTTANPATNTLFGLNPDTLAVRWTFDNGAGTNGIGIISGQPLVDYATNRVYFTSRQLAGGSSSTVWCLSFNETNATKVWEANVGSVDASVTLSNGTLYVGNLDGTVHALNAADGTHKWTAPFVTGDGPVKSLVWSAGTGNRLFFSTTRKTWAITDNGPGTAPTAYWTPPPVITSPSNPLVLAGKAFVGTGTGQLLQFDVTTPTPPAPVGVALTPHPEQLGRPTIDSSNGVIYVGTDEGTIHAASYPF